MPKHYKSVTGVSDEEAEFEKLLAESGIEVGPRVVQGELMRGRIISIGPEAAFIDLGGKAEGVMDSHELVDLGLGPGDEVEALVVSTQGEVRLSRTLAAAGRDREALQSAFQMGLPVQGKITGRNKGGFDVSVGGQSAFLPVSHLALESVEDLDAWVGQSHRFKIIEHDPAGRRLVVSRADLLREEREEQSQKLWEELRVGDVRQGTVRSIADYGVFVDIGGADGLCHVTALKWGRVAHPRDVVAVGQEVTVTVAELDRERKRIGLSMKSAAGDPWKRLGTEIREGDSIQGEVTRVEKYGAFVEILPGVEGLVHVSELTFLRRVRHPSEVVAAGDRVQCTVLAIDHAKQRVSLSMKQVEGDPWRDVVERFPPGAIVRGVVQRTAAFGVFVDVAPGVTALLPGSETDYPAGSDLARNFRPGDEIQAAVLSVDPEARRMSLSIRAVAAAEEEREVTDWRQAHGAKKGGGGFGTFADLLKGVKVDQ